MDRLEATKWAYKTGKIHKGRIDPETINQMYGFTTCGKDFMSLDDVFTWAQDWHQVGESCEITCLHCRRELKLDAPWVAIRIGDTDRDHFEISVCREDYTSGMENITNAGRKKIILWTHEDYDDDDTEWMMKAAEHMAYGLNFKAHYNVPRDKSNWR